MSWRGRQSGPAQPFRDSLRSDRTAPVPSALVSLLPAPGFSCYAVQHIFLTPDETSRETLSCAHFLKKIPPGGCLPRRSRLDP